MGRKKWKVAKVNKETAASLAEVCNVDAFVALLMLARGISNPEEISSFFDNSRELCDPFELTDMEKAVNRIDEAIFSYEPITIFGDYDADGITATAVLYSFLDAQGANVSYYIPDRAADGYGLSMKIVDKLHEMGAKLIITVDNGINAIKEAEYIKELGMALIVTDHHLPDAVLPDAVAVVDPHRKDCNCSFKDWAGVGVAFKLVSAIEGGDPNELLHHFADFIALGTVADVALLNGENRKLVKSGIRMINKRERYGIEALRHFSGVRDREITASNISFGLAPRINAAGRMGSADRALRLLLCEDAEEAAALSAEIDRANTERQEAEQKILKEVEAKLWENPMRQYDKILVVSGEGWHEGVIGIVASRLVEKYFKPCFVITSSGDISKGSGRSIDGFSLYDALIAGKDHLEYYGGHELAAGFTIKTDNIDAFREALNHYTASIEMPYPVLNIDCKLNPQFMNLDLVRSISVLEPFGACNPQPLFGLFDMVIDSVQPIGDKKQHIRITLHKNGKDERITALKFGLSHEDFPFKAGDAVDSAVYLDSSEYLGELRLNILLKDIRFAGVDDDKLAKDHLLFESVMRRDAVSAQAAAYALPSRALFTCLYKYIKANDGWRYSNEILWARIKCEDNNYCRVLVALEVFKELGILVCRENGTLSLPEETVKSDLNASDILKFIEEKRCSHG